MAFDKGKRAVRYREAVANPSFTIPPLFRFLRGLSIGGQSL